MLFVINRFDQENRTARSPVELGFVFSFLSFFSVENWTSNNCRRSWDNNGLGGSGWRLRQLEQRIALRQSRAELWGRSPYCGLLGCWSLAWSRCQTICRMENKEPSRGEIWGLLRTLWDLQKWSEHHTSLLLHLIQRPVEESRVLGQGPAC